MSYFEISNHICERSHIKLMHKEYYLHNINLYFLLHIPKHINYLYNKHMPEAQYFLKVKYLRLKYNFVHLKAFLLVYLMFCYFCNSPNLFLLSRFHVHDKKKIKFGFVSVLHFPNEKRQKTSSLAEK